MLTVLGPASRALCDGVSRRGFIRLGALGTAITLADVLRAQESRATSGAAVKPGSAGDRSRVPPGTAVILWWMGGGPSQHETYDPKPDAPDVVRGPFKSIPTAAPGVRFNELLPLQAKVADKVAILRSMSHYDYNHPDAAHLVQTGYHEKNVQFRGQFYPAQGSVVAKVRGANAVGMPPYVCIPDAYFARQGFYQLATYLGNEFDPVNSGSEPTFRFTGPGPSFTLPADVTVRRAEDRKELLRRLDSATKRAEPVVGGLDAAHQKAFDLVTSRAAKEAFDLSREPQKVRESYGTNPWGRGALLARRLVEAGVTFVTVNHYEADVDWWDDHYTIEKNIKTRLPPFDRALAALIEDVHARGLANRVLIVAMGEFGRGTKIDSLAGRGHWAKAMSVLLSGGAVKGGRAVGATTADGGEPATHRYGPGDVLATIYHHLGIDHADSLPDKQGRPVRLVDVGEPIRELF
ncbi:MAG: DUF1501 domain-containing protein [Planctomycetes bacterium]|nr:DUF1501 domain-containing protein [Planctomycetota bacterium]